MATSGLLMDGRNNTGTCTGAISLVHAMHVPRTAPRFCNQLTDGLVDTARRRFGFANAW
ncbi:hypothetical protein Poly59_27420 [Rubripirellula reticaptiva]|uniref:Uncharacterized protein n=1 Tax=Rubripirellula reticaptiva TaxID=2528013 RepID=A0A5C6EPV8_9BACT|nr:hypothetical protein Poly59_27420 [Rubripirellula reticaptiva]